MMSVVKNITTVYILLLLLLKMMALPIACLEYEVNKAFIAANLCENKDKPVLQCHGKCHLNKQLAKAVETPGSSSQKGATLNISLDFFVKTDTYFFTPSVAAESRSFQWKQDNRAAAGYLSSVFHPPASIL